MTTTTHRDATRTAPQSIGSHPAGPELRTTETAGITTAASRWLAITRIALGLVFVWAFLDKTFGLSYSTPAARAWINGGSPTAGFLSHVKVGPFAGVFRAIGGNPVVDWLFMIG